MQPRRGRFFFCRPCSCVVLHTPCWASARLAAPHWLGRAAALLACCPPPTALSPLGPACDAGRHPSFCRTPACLARGRPRFGLGWVHRLRTGSRFFAEGLSAALATQRWCHNLPSEEARKGAVKRLGDGMLAVYVLISAICQRRCRQQRTPPQTRAAPPPLNKQLKYMGVLKDRPDRGGRDEASFLLHHLRFLLRVCRCSHSPTYSMDGQNDQKHTSCTLARNFHEAHAPTSI
jgi:hypothetical protein